MRKWIWLLVLLVVGAGVVGYDVYRAQSVAVETIRLAEAGRAADLAGLIRSSAITDKLYRDTEPLVEEPVPVEEVVTETGFWGGLWNRGKSLIGQKDEEKAPEPPPLPLDLHMCAQTLGEPQGFADLIRYLKPQPVSPGLKPDPRVSYGSFNTRQYLIRQNGGEAHYLLISRTNLLDWQVTGVRLSENVRRQIARTCLGVI